MRKLNEVAKKRMTKKRIILNAKAEMDANYQKNEKVSEKSPDGPVRASKKKSINKKPKKEKKVVTVKK